MNNKLSINFIKHRIFFITDILLIQNKYTDNATYFCEIGNIFVHF